MRCDADTAYLHKFDIYLGRRQNSEYGLRYDVMKLCQEITGKYDHVYFDNLFTSVPLMKDLVALNTYACGTVCKNKCGMLDAVKWPGKMRQGASKTLQLGHTNLVATVWEDNKTVRVLSTNCEPQNVQVADGRIGRQMVQINQPQNVYSYNKYMSGVDRHDQM